VKTNNSSSSYQAFAEYFFAPTVLIQAMASRRKAVPNLGEKYNFIAVLLIFKIIIIPIAVLSIGTGPSAKRGAAAANSNATTNSNGTFSL
jgi:hypothetical protein